MSSKHEVSLYFAPGSSSLLPHFLLYHCNVPFTLQSIRLNDPAAPTILAQINDKLQVPVLLLDGEAITENPATVHAIHHLAPDARIFGGTPMDFIRVCEWMNWISASLHAQAWSPWMRPFRFTTSEDPTHLAGVKETAARNVLERFTRIEGKVIGPWALGETFTAVDVYLAVFWRCGRDFMNADMEARFPRWGALVRELEGMEAWGRVMRDEEAARKKFDV